MRQGVWLLVVERWNCSDCARAPAAGRLRGPWLMSRVALSYMSWSLEVWFTDEFRKQRSDKVVSEIGTLPCTAWMVGGIRTRWRELAAAAKPPAAHRQQLSLTSDASANARRLALGLTLKDTANIMSLLSYFIQDSKHSMFIKFFHFGYGVRR